MVTCLSEWQWPQVLTSTACAQMISQADIIPASLRLYLCRDVLTSHVQLLGNKLPDCERLCLMCALVQVGLGKHIWTAKYCIMHCKADIAGTDVTSPMALPSAEHSAEKSSSFMTAGATFWAMSRAALTFTATAASGCPMILWHLDGIQEYLQEE